MLRIRKRNKNNKITATIIKCQKKKIMLLSPLRFELAMRNQGLCDLAFSLAGGGRGAGSPVEPGCQRHPLLSGAPALAAPRVGSPKGHLTQVPEGSCTPTRTSLAHSIPALSASNLCCPPCVQDPASASEILCLSSLPSPRSRVRFRHGGAGDQLFLFPRLRGRGQRGDRLLGEIAALGNPDACEG